MRAVATALAALITALPCSAEDATGARAEQLYKNFLDKAQSLEIMPDEGEQPLQLVKTPLFRFATEGTVFGSVFVWHDADQRLALVGTIGSLPIRGTDMQFVELHLLKAAPIEPLTFPGFPTKRWQPDVKGLQPAPLPNAPPVAANARLRLTQMRSLARQFDAAMIHDGQTNNLRLLPQPLYRYNDPTQQRDGALFAYVWDNGTDPELLLRIETIEEDGRTTWHYQPIRFTWRQLKLEHRGEQVWQIEEFLERNAPLQQTPYITGLTERVPSAPDTVDVIGQ
ncbi:hypothetical protein [Roseimaritima ulvae]|nr:hypothetical protein [Roseimaritima ulvae]